MGNAAKREGICQNVAKIVRRERERRGLSLHALAAKTGLSRQMIAFVEQGERNPSLETLLRLSEALDKNLDEILREARLNSAA